MIDDLTQYNRGEFLTDAFNGVKDRRLDLLGAERLVRAAHFGTQRAQDPKLEHCYYALLMEELCRSHPVEPDALQALIEFIDRSPAPLTEDPYIYTLQEEDSLAGVAERFGTTVASILKTNPFLEPPCFVTPGMRLQVPGNLTYVASRVEPVSEAAAHLTEYVRCFDPQAEVRPEELVRRNALPRRPLRPGQAIAFPFSPFDDEVEEAGPA